MRFTGGRVWLDRRSGVLEDFSGSFDDDLREDRDDLCRCFPLGFDGSAS